MSESKNEEENWKLRAEIAESSLERTKAEARTRIIYAELRAEATKAGMIDLDGLKLLDTDTLNISDDGSIEDVSAVFTKLKRAKPWLFGSGKSSSALTNAPSPELPRQRMATEMSHDEWLSARAALLKKH